MNVLDRFIEKVEKTDNCWIWLARKTKQGYGRFYFKGRNSLAHRVAYEIFSGEVGEMHVLHRCDNPSCVNPGHLFLGTNADNVADKISKGREPSHVGERNNRSKLKETDVLAIREDAKNGVSQYLLAKRYSVTQTQISSIVRRKAWRHI